MHTISSFGTIDYVQTRKQSFEFTWNITDQHKYLNLRESTSTEKRVLRQHKIFIYGYMKRNTTERNIVA